MRSNDVNRVLLAYFLLHFDFASALQQDDSGWNELLSQCMYSQAAA